MRGTTLINVAALLLLLAGWLGFGEINASAEPIDRLMLGDTTSEVAHEFEAETSEIVAGGLGQPARRLVPEGGDSWEGGRMAFVMQVDREQQCYLTVRYWGGESDTNHLLLFCEGKQVGYRHLGDIDAIGPPCAAPPYPGRFWHVTTPVPRAITAGRDEVRFEIRASGPTWVYGRTFALYQRPMEQASRGIYEVITHAAPCYEPPPAAPQGSPLPDRVRETPTADVLVALRARVNQALGRKLATAKPLSQMEALLLARAAFVPWTVAHGANRVVPQVIRAADAQHAAWKVDPQAVWDDRATWNPGWYGLGPMAEAVRLLADDIDPFLDEPLPDGTPRRQAWAAMFRASRDHLRAHRRSYTNQTLFIDTNIFRSDRGLAVVDREAAWTDAEALRYLHEATGLADWRGSDTAHGSERPWGNTYRQFTAAGLSRELGYVGGYGEILGQLVDAYDATRRPGGTGDPALKAQIVKAQRGRLPFRHPLPDADGFRAMRLETAIGWRDSSLPGSVTYAQRGHRDESPLSAAALTLDPPAVAATRQFFEDNQFFATVADMLADRNLRTEFGLLRIPEEYETLKRQPDVALPMPMSPGALDFCFLDPENAVVAVRQGDEILYASLYWRSLRAINGLARVHWLTPRWQNVAVVHVATRCESSGRSWQRPDWTTFGFGSGPRYPNQPESAHRGEELLVPQLPADVLYNPNQDNPYAGRADLYELCYGPWFIAINTTASRAFDVTVPHEFGGGTDLVSGDTIASGTVRRLAGRTGLVVRRVERSLDE